MSADPTLAGLSVDVDSVSMHGTVVIGEGEKDEAPMLFNGEEVGDGTGPGVDVAVDPIDGRRLTPVGQPAPLRSCAARTLSANPQEVFGPTVTRLPHPLML